MSISDTTLPVSRDNDGSYQLLDGHAYGVGDLLVNSYEKSPYTDTEIISLDVGPTQTRYRVHRAVLSQSPELENKPALKLWGEKTNDTIPLPELDETTAHTLVHYLYTGRYQTLRSYTLAEKAVIPEYKLSTCVYCAAIRYKLAGLAELAKEKITAFGEDLSILEILSVARDNAFPLLPEDEAWYPAYLEDAIKGAVAEDPGLFTQRGFVDQIEGDRKFRQVVMSAIVNTLSQGSVVLSPKRTEAQAPATIDQEVKLPAHDETNGSTTQTTPQVETKTSSNAAPASKEPVSIAESVLSDNVKLDEIEPTLETPATEAPEAPEPFTDELGSKSSKTYQQMRKKAEDSTSKAANSPTAVTDAPATKPAHKRTDSVIQPDEATAPAVNEVKRHVAPEVKKPVATEIKIPAVEQKKPIAVESKKPAVVEQNKPAAVVEEKKPAPIEEKKPIANEQQKPVSTEEPKPTTAEPASPSPVIVDGTNGAAAGLSKKAKKREKAKKKAAGASPAATTTIVAT